MTAKQFRVLYREFLFRIVDRELLSTHARGDMSQLLLQIATLLIFLSVCFALPALRFLTLDRSGPVVSGLWFEWSIQHFLIATTMLIVGVLAVLSWRSMFPDHRDVLVLAPLPIRAHTLLLAKLSALATALALTVGALHVVAGAAWPLAFNVVGERRTVPAFTTDAALPPVAVTDLPRVLQGDLAEVLRDGPLAPRGVGGVAIGVFQKGVRRVLAYGRAAPDSIFEIGSVTKPFTALALAGMVEQGEVRLDQPVRELIPQARLSPPRGPEITLLDLATHRSGLPPLPWNLRPRDVTNPYVDYDETRLYVFLENRGLERGAQEPFVYSNLGYGLLAHALAQRAGLGYPTLIRRTVTEPLGLTDTAVDLSAEQTRRFLQGHDDRLRPVRPWDTAVFAGAGALRSTASDVLTLLEANLHPERIPGLQRALVASQQSRAPRSEDGSIALAWMIDNQAGSFHHGGAVAGFTADAFFDPDEDVAVIVLSNIGPGSAVSADVVAQHVRARIAGTPAIAIAEAAIPAAGSARSWIRLLLAYWFTMGAAAVFIFGLAVVAQGLAAALLPHRLFLRMSSFLQLGGFCLIVGIYFLQPIGITPTTLVDVQRDGWWSPPSFWFLALFQAVNGSSALAPLAQTAWTALGLSVTGIVAAYALEYARTLRRIAEEPDITPAVTRLRRLPAFGSAFPTAIVRFSIRTLLRSSQHRVLLAFYWGIGVAITTLLLKTPRAQPLGLDSSVTDWQEGSVRLIVASIWMMGCAVIAAKLAFSLPRELPANWIFRIMPIADSGGCVRAARRALMAVSVLPVWTVSALVFLWAWPVRPAIVHLAALGLTGLVFVEIALRGARKIPFTCSYLPGKSRLHIAAYIALALLLPLTFTVADLERNALDRNGGTAMMLGSLVVIWGAFRWSAARLDDELLVPRFDEEPPDRTLTLELWDSRFPQSG
jgi:CubicO group peptidase (beta-lactamase class C family)